jgi:hypothetical protein
MAAKDIRFSTDARDRILRGVEVLTLAQTQYTPLPHYQRPYQHLIESTARCYRSDMLLGSFILYLNSVAR